MEVWQRLKNGDKKALAELYKDHVDILYRYGMKVAGDRSVVEDCIQNLFVTIWEKRANLGDTDSVKNYLLASLRRSIYKYHSKKEVSTDPTQPRTEDGSVELSFEQLTIDKEMDEERKEKFQRALKNISSRQREVIYLRYFEDKDYNEICEIMDISYQGARNMLFKALRSLKEHLSITIIFIIKWVTNSPSDYF